MKRYKIELTLGDPSGDGHEKTEKFLIFSNKTKSEIQDGYKKSIDITNIDLSKICNNYDDNVISDHNFIKLKEFIPNLTFNNTEYIRPEEFAELWFKFVKISIPDFEWEYPDESDIQKIGAYYDKEFPYSFGYGLFE